MNRHGLGWVALLLGGVMGASMTESAAEGVQPGELLRQAEEAFQLQNYNDALDKAQRFLETKPSSEQVDQASNIAGQSHLAIGNVVQGHKMLRELVERSPRYASNPLTVRKLASASHQTGHPADYIRYEEQAIQLYRQSKEPREANALLSDLAMFYRNLQHQPDPANADRAVVQVDGSLRAIATLERVLANEPTIDEQISAWREQSNIYLQASSAFSQVPKEKWPAGVEVKGDPTRPIDTAINLQRQIVTLFPENPDAAQALLQIAQIQSDHQQDFVAAVQTAREVLAKFGRLKDPVRDAKFLIEQITSPQLSLQTQGVVRPGEKVKFAWSARNIATIDFEAYKVDLFDVLRQESPSTDLVSSIARMAPSGEAVARWSVETGDKGEHRHLQSNDRPAESPLSTSGAYLVVARGRGTNAKLSTVALVSQLAMVTKVGKTKADFFVVDVQTGRPVVGSKVLARRFLRFVNKPVLPIPGIGGQRQVAEFDFRELPVPDNGLAEYSLEERPNIDDRFHHQVVAVARAGEDFAATFTQSWFGWWGWSDGEYGYIYTDRPVYRPGQTVHFRVLLRRYLQGNFVLNAGQKVTLTVTDTKGEKVYSQDHVTSEEGSLSGSFVLGAEPALGSYSIAVAMPEGYAQLNPGGQFRVEEYRKPEFTVEVSSDKPLHKLGDKMRIRIHGEYYFGGAVAGAKVNYTIHRESVPTYYPWLRPFDWFYAEEGVFRGRIWPPQPHRQDLILQGEIQTDAQGNAVVEIATEPFANEPNADVQYKVDVTLVDSSRREIQGSQTIKVGRRAFTISAEPRKHLYQPGDTVKVGVKGENINGQPVSFEGNSIVSFVKRREQRGEGNAVTQAEELQSLETGAVSIGPEGEGEIRFTADQEGLFKVVIESADPFAPGEKILGSTYVWVAKAGGAHAHYAQRDLELVLEKETYRAGESAKLLINCRQPDSYVLLSADGDDIYRAQVIWVKGNQVVVDWPIDATFRPSVQIHATTIGQNKIFEDSVTMKVPPVEQFLTVKLVASKEEFLPREQATVDVLVTDHEGKPARGVELSLGVFDASTLYIQGETRGDIRKYFHGRQRPVSVQTTSSFFFWPQQVYLPRRPMGRMVGGMGGMDMMRASMAEMPASAPMAKGGEAPAEEAAGGEMAETEIRTDFRDTVFWAAHLLTDQEGKASASITFPDSLTRWRLTAIGADRQTRVGEVIHEVRTKKNILVRLEIPRFLVEGDTFTASAIVHNYFPEAKDVQVELIPSEGLVPSTDPAGLATAGRRQVRIPAGGEVRVDLPLVASRVGMVSVTAKGLSKEGSDAMKLEVPCYEYGARKLLAESGILFGNATSRQANVRLTIPQAIAPGSQSLTVRVSPTAAGVMLESLPYLIDYPYGCVEQTMSRFLPAVLTARTLEELGIKLGDLAKIPVEGVVRERLAKFQSPVYQEAKLRAVILAGLARLADFQKVDGGWGWWKNDESNPYMTAYVVAGLAAAQHRGVIPQTGRRPNLALAVDYLVARAGSSQPVRPYPWMNQDDLSLRAYMLYAIGQADAQKLLQPDCRAQLMRLFVARDQLTDYARALLAMAEADGGLSENAQILASNIIDRAVVSKETGSASWGKASGYYYWYDGGTEATSYSLKALLRLSPQSPLIPQAVNWLVRQRQGTRWFNTKDTATACYALADYLKATGELDPDLTIMVEVDGREVRRSRVTKENLFTFDDEVQIPAEELGTGTKEIVLRTEGRGNAYWSAYAGFFTKEEQIESAGHEVYVTRRYEKLLPKKVTKTRTVYDPTSDQRKEETYEAIEYDRAPIASGDQLASGDLIEVSLDIDARNNFEYVMFEDPKPAGCEPTELQSGYQWGTGFGTHTELRDEKVAFFASYLPQGKHTIAYRLRAENPGEFHALPAFGECMYSPFVRGSSASAKIRIIDVPSSVPAKP